MSHRPNRTRLIACMVYLLAISCTPVPPARNAPSAEEIVRRYFEQVLNQGDADMLEQLLAESVTLRVPPSLAPGPVVESREAFAELVASLHTTFPDLQFTIDDVVAETDVAMASWTMQGTHSDQWLGVPATGRQVTLTGVDIFHVADGRIQQIRIHADYLGVLRQLGALPE